MVIHHKDDNGKYVVHDPYWGPNIFLDSTRENIGVLYGSSTSIDQMIIYHNTKRSPSDLPPIDAPAPSNKTKANQNLNSNKNSMSANEYDKISGQINNVNSNQNNSNSNKSNSNSNKNKNKNTNGH